MDLLKNHVNVTFKFEIISQQFTQKKEIRFEISDSFKTMFHSRGTRTNHAGCYQIKCQNPKPPKITSNSDLHAVINIKLIYCQIRNSMQLDSGKF